MSTDYDTFVEETFAERPDLARPWEEKRPMRVMALALTELRKNAGLTQRDLADKAGWEQSYVAHLESALERMPSPETVARFAEACEAEAGLVLIRKGPSGIEITDTIALSSGSTAVEHIAHIADEDKALVTEQFSSDAAAGYKAV